MLRVVCFLLGEKRNHEFTRIIHISAAAAAGCVFGGSDIPGHLAVLVTAGSENNANKFVMSHGCNVDPVSCRSTQLEKSAAVCEPCS